MRQFLKRAFADMKASAKAQHVVDKAQWKAVKAEARADFEEHRGGNVTARLQKERESALAEAEKRCAAAEERYEAARRRRTCEKAE